MNTFKKVLGWFCIATVLGLGVTMLAFPASITQLAGLAVAQSSTQWNSLKDMAQGDGQQNGVMLASPCLWNGTTCDRQRGTISGGATVSLANLSINPPSFTSVEGATLQNSTQTSAANTAQTITLTGSAGTRVTIDFVEAFLSAAGVCTLTIVDNATTVYSHPLTSQVATSQLQVPLGNDGLSISTGSNATVNVGACNAAITSTLNVVASRQ
jgi:hypothetical protein